MAHEYSEDDEALFRRLRDHHDELRNHTNALLAFIRLEKPLDWQRYLDALSAPSKCN